MLPDSFVASASGSFASLMRADTVRLARTLPCPDVAVKPGVRRIPWTAYQVFLDPVSPALLQSPAELTIVDSELDQEATTDMKREVILPAGATPGGILSPGVRVGDLLWTAGSTGS